MSKRLMVSLLLIFCAVLNLRSAKAQCKSRYFDSSYGVLVIAHRGFSGVAPENTLIAFQKAIEIGADMLEFDVLHSRDGHIVVIHDDTLDRTTNGHGGVSDYSLAELKQLDAGSWFSPEFANERIPTLREALELTRGKIRVNIEIKFEAVNLVQFGPGIEDEIVDLVEELGMEQDVMVSSFHPMAVERIKKRNPNIVTALLYHDVIKKSPSAILKGLRADGFNPSLKHVKPQHIDEAHAAGHPVTVYTVNQAEDLQTLINWGVDGIFTDFPDRLLKLLSQSHTSCS